MFESPLFDLAISHRFALTKVMRQSENDTHFLNALAEIRLGWCSKDSEEYIRSLKRSLSAEIPVTLMNRKELEKLPGDLLVYKLHNLKMIIPRVGAGQGWKYYN